MYHRVFRKPFLFLGKKQSVNWVVVVYVHLKTAGKDHGGKRKRWKKTRGESAVFAYINFDPL